MKKDKLENIVFDCMTELYANAEPPAVFGSLIEQARERKDADSQGRLNIHFEDYLIDNVVYDAICDKYIKKYRLKGSDLMFFNFNVHLGASPKCKYKQ
jgi:hypothetical protein